MDTLTIEGVILTPLKQVFHPKGDIFHAMKRSDPGFNGFGEAYFSTVNSGDIKGWKKHLRMMMNLVVPVGKIRFVIHDIRDDSKTFGDFFSVCLSVDNYQRLTVPPGVWVGFQGMGEGLNLLLNLADLEHDPAESENLPIESFKYDWGRAQ
jgi:dTDP-4-dehydrorhamnose 3,5-epimerase